MSNKLINQVIKNIKRGKILIQDHSSHVQSIQASTNCLAYKSYIPTLTKDHFISLLPNIQLTEKVKDSNVPKFELWKVRDAKYFLFKDQYLLQFPTNLSMSNYLKQTSLSKLDDRAVEFDQYKIEQVNNTLLRYRYHLKCAFQSKEKYFQSLIENTPNDFDVNPLEIKNIESKCLLIWGLPIEWKQHQIKSYFWWYDIKDCFKLYWDNLTCRNLRFISFHGTEDALRFRNNLHGTQLENSKLTVEKL